MNEEERRRCCLLGGCGCGPAGSAAQRKAMLEWLTSKIIQPQYPGKLYGTPEETATEINGWLDELPWGKVPAAS